MPFIGNQPAESYSAFQKQDFSTSATTSYTLDNPVANANELALFINFVRQEPTTAYSASGTSLTLTSATASSDDMYCVYLGKAVQTVNPPNASVGASQIVDASITSGKLASGVLPTNTPSFFAYRTSSVQNFSQNTATKLQFNTELYDTDNCYDNSTNYRFTPTTAGKYYISAGAYIDGTSTASPTGLKLYKNGSFYHTAFIYSGGLAGGHHIHNIVDFNGSSDYAEIFVESGNSSPFINFQPGSSLSTFFCAYKIIGA